MMLILADPGGANGWGWVRLTRFNLATSIRTDEFLGHGPFSF